MLKEKADKRWQGKLEQVLPLISDDQQEGLLQRVSREEQESIVDGLLKTPTVSEKTSTKKTSSSIDSTKAAFEDLCKLTKLTRVHCCTFSKLWDNLKSPDFWKKATDVLASFFNTFGSPELMQQPHLSNVDFMTVTAQRSPSLCSLDDMLALYTGGLEKARTCVAEMKRKKLEVDFGARFAEVLGCIAEGRIIDQLSSI